MCYTTWNIGVVHMSLNTLLGKHSGIVLFFSSYWIALSAKQFYGHRFNGIALGCLIVLYQEKKRNFKKRNIVFLGVAVTIIRIIKYYKSINFSFRALLIIYVYSDLTKKKKTFFYVMTLHFEAYLAPSSGVYLFIFFFFLIVSQQKFHTQTAIKC